jgi:signal transduction histidine kinase
MLTLPELEQLPGGAFTTLFLAALIFWLIRSVCAGMSRYKYIATNISALSVKNAVDSLFTGLMYYEENGFILLSNTRMQSLMTAITGRVRRNGRLFYRMLLNEEIEPGCRIASFEGHRVCLLHDDSAWMFTASVLFIRKKRYTQLTATDISERWKLTEELQSQNEELKQRQRELDDTIANLHILSHEQETQKARMRAHDILGERPSLLLRTVRSEQALDFTLLLSLSQGLMDEIKAVESALSPEDAFDILKREFETIGVEIVLDGELPGDGVKSLLFVEIIRESVTNAVRHGLATQVTVRIDESPAGLRMEITDNGRLLSDTITEGGGIRGMKEKIKPFGGVLSITTQPGIKLKVDLPVEADG